MDLVEKLSHNNDLINSKEENEKIQRKLKFLQQWIKYDNNLSKVEHVKYLIEKNMNSEELTFDDLKILDSYYKEEKSKLQNKGDSGDKNKNSKQVEKIQLQEENPNNNDDLENENNQNDGIDDGRAMNRSKIFERGLREKSSNEYPLQRRCSNMGRVSLADTYKSRISNPNNNVNSNINNQCRFQLAKDIDPTSKEKDKNENQQVSTPNKSQEKEDSLFRGGIPNSKNSNPNLKSNSKKPSNSQSLEEIDEIQKIISNTRNAVNEIENKIKDDKLKRNSPNNMNDFIHEDKEQENPIPEEIEKYSNFKNDNDHRKPPEFKNNNNYKPDDEIAEEINEDSKVEPSFLSKKDFQCINNSQRVINQSYIRNMSITQSNFEFNPTIKMGTDTSSNFRRSSCPSHNKVESEISFVFVSNPPPNPKRYTRICQEINFNLKSNSNIKPSFKRLLDNVNNFDINSCNERELNTLEDSLENLLDSIRMKKGQGKEDVAMNKMIEKYSALLIKNINEKLLSDN